MPDNHHNLIQAACHFSARAYSAGLSLLDADVSTGNYQSFCGVTSRIGFTEKPKTFAEDVFQQGTGQFLTNERYRLTILDCNQYQLIANTS